jgi:hypothetical protein
VDCYINVQESLELEVDSKRQREWGAEGRETEDDEGYRSNKFEDELRKVTPRKQPNILKIGASRSYAVTFVGVDRLVADTVGSNTALGMVDVCSRLSVLCCPVYIEASATG